MTTTVKAFNHTMLKFPVFGDVAPYITVGATSQDKKLNRCRGNNLRFHKDNVDRIKIRSLNSTVSLEFNKIVSGRKLP
jgi:hypothetical protein